MITMSNNAVIKLEKVGKQYRIGKERKRQTIWALKDVSFEVQQGET